MDGSFINGMWYAIYITALVLFFLSLVFGNIGQKKTAKIFNSLAESKTVCGVEAKRFSMILLNMAGIDDVEVDEVNGLSTDCYNPDFKVIKLSKKTIDATTLSALGYCAHEVGHAIQHNVKYRYYIAKLKLAPIFNFFAKLFFPFMIIGSLLSFTFKMPNIGLIFLWFAIISFSLSFIFYLVILPVERDACKRIVPIIEKCEFLTTDEINILTIVLKSALWTYSTDLTSSMLFFVKFLSYERILDEE